MTRRVVVGYDGSEAAEDALAFGLVWCGSTGDVPIVATVYPEEHPLGAGRVDAEWAAHVRERAVATLAGARQVAGAVAQYRHIASTSAAHGLADLAEDVGAAVVILGGSRGEARTSGVLGSTTDRLLHGATVPVTVVPEGWTAPDSTRITRIGVAFVDTRDGHEALRVAIRAAARVPTRLTVYTVMARSSEHYSYIAGRADETEFYDAAQESYQRALDYAIAGVPAELAARSELLRGDVVDELSALGPDDVDLLVCGSRGYGPLRRVLLGGVSSRLVRRSRLPVTVVPRAAASTPAE
jgi:nucleotide-binding universal stress UspA family protein